MKRVSAKPLFILLGFVAVGCALYAAQVRQPRFQGRTLTEWLMDFDDRKGNINAPVVAAIRQIRTNALPIILEVIRPEDSRFYPNDPAELRQERAAAAFEALGAIAKPAVPDLLVLLNNKDATTYAARALMAIDWSAEVAREAIQSLTKENDHVRSSITLLLRSVGTNGSAAVPTLIGFLRDRNLSR